LLNVRETKFVGLETFHFPKPFDAAQLSERILSLKETSSLLKNVNSDKVSVQFSNHHYTFIPASLFKNEEAEKYFFFNHPKKIHSKIESEQIKAFDIVNIFSADEQVLSTLENVF